MKNILKSIWGFLAHNKVLLILVSFALMIATVIIGRSLPNKHWPICLFVIEAIYPVTILVIGLIYAFIINPIRDRKGEEG